MQDRIALRGSLRPSIPDSTVIGSPDPHEPISVTLVLRRRAGASLPEPGSMRVSHEEFAELYGADPSDMRLIEGFAAENDLTVVEEDLARRSVVLWGTTANMAEAFGTELLLFQSPQGTFRGRVGQLYVPSELSDVVTGVFGLDERPQARSHLRRLVVGPRAAGDTSYTPQAVAALYDYPKATGAGQTIALIELGGGYKASDLTTYFKNAGIQPAPKVVAISVDGVANEPTGDANGPDGEVLLDIEVAGSIAPGATIAVYFAPNTDQGFLDAITTAIHDTTRKPFVISISWGGAESSWTAQALTNFDQAFQDAAALGVTVCCASGDDGSADGISDGKAHVDFPASSPNALACGGTRLQSSGGKITTEVVWNSGSGNGASGGGVSETFPLPSYQANVKAPVSVNPPHFKGRGVPDVAGNADPATGYEIYVDGRSGVFGGTSAVAPLWAGLVALVNEQLGQPVGFLQPTLYTAAAEAAMRDITAGSNGAYQAGSGWDACTGLGSPDGAKLLSALTSLKRPTPTRRHTEKHHKAEANS